MAYNITGLESAHTFVGVFSELDTLTHGLLVLFILFTIYIIMLVVMESHTLKISSMVAGFITSVIAIMMYAGGFVGTNIIIIPIVVFIGSILIYLFSE